MGIRAFMPAITRSSSYWSEETILSRNAYVWKSCYPIEGQVTFKDEYAVIFLSIKFHSLFICKWYDPAINIPINWIYFDEWEGNTHDTVARWSAYNISITISKMRETNMQNLPRRAGSWSLLVCLLAWWFTFEVWLYRKRVFRNRNQFASCIN